MNFVNFYNPEKGGKNLGNITEKPLFYFSLINMINNHYQWFIHPTCIYHLSNKRLYLRSKQNALDIVHKLLVQVYWLIAAQRGIPVNGMSL